MFWLFCPEIVLTAPCTQTRYMLMEFCLCVYLSVTLLELTDRTSKHIAVYFTSHHSIFVTK